MRSNVDDDDDDDIMNMVQHGVMEVTSFKS